MGGSVRAGIVDSGDFRYTTSMSLNLVLYLRPEEKTLFQTLHEGAVEWDGEIRDEVLGGYEDPELIERRLQNPSYADDPEYVRWIAKTQREAMAVGNPTRAAIAGFPEDLLPAFFETCGATGISVLVEEILRNPQFGRKALEGLCALTQLRHEILQRNSVAA